MRALLWAVPILIMAPAPARAAERRLAVTDIHPAGYTRSAPTAINNRGDVLLFGVNQVGSETRPPLGFVWRAGRFTALRPLPGGNGTLASDINENGVAVGFC